MEDCRLGGLQGLLGRGLAGEPVLAGRAFRPLEPFSRPLPYQSTRVPLGKAQSGLRQGLACWAGVGVIQSSQLLPSSPPTRGFGIPKREERAVVAPPPCHWGLSCQIRGPSSGDHRGHRLGERQVILPSRSFPMRGIHCALPSPVPFTSAASHWVSQVR